MAQDLNGLFRYLRRPRELVALLRTIPPEDAKTFADALDQHDQELEDWLEQHPGLKLSTSPPAGVTAEQTGAAGVGPAAAPWDHVHETTAETPLNLAVGDTADEGASLGTILQRRFFARATHRHGVPTGTPVAVGAANAAGASTSVPRLDHVHAQATTIHGTAWRNATQTITAAQDNANILVQFNTVVENVGLTWDAVNYEWEILTAGVYFIETGGLWDLSGAPVGTRHSHIVKNPRTARVVLRDKYQPEVGVDGAAAGYGTEQASTEATRMVRLAVGDRIAAEVLKRTDSGTPVDVGLLSVSQWSPLLTITRIGP